MTVARVDRLPPALAPGHDPLLVPACTAGWPVQELVDVGGLAERFGDVEIVARDGPSEWRVAVREFLAWCADPGADRRWYVKDWVVSDRIAELVGGPLPAAFECWLDLLPPGYRPRWQWLFAGPVGSSSRLHVDVMCSTAWNALLRGRKRWRLLSPAAAAREGLLEPAVAAACDSRPRVVELDQVAGECLVVPAGWAHEVVNVEWSIALTGNFVNASNVRAVRALHEDADRTAWLTLLSRLERSVATSARGCLT
ncbi:MAG: hypothetical protein ACT4RN_13135 [Pseudonocardia sp.]